MSRSAEPVQRSAPNPVAGDDVRVIKKYPNRRLYDTSASCYITLAQVRQRVMERDAFVVRDAKSGEDLTRSVLLQIILEEEAAGAPMFTEAVLADIIRFYGHALRGFMGPYLEKNIQALAHIQAKLAEQAQDLSPEMWSQFLKLQSPLMQSLMGSYMEQTQAAFLQMQEQMARHADQMLGVFGMRR